MLNIDKTSENGVLTLNLEGKLDTITALQLEDILKEDLEGITDLTIDLKKLEYISSAGLRVLLSAQKTMNLQGKMTVASPNSLIMGIFEDTGFVNILTIK